MTGKVKAKKPKVSVDLLISDHSQAFRTNQRVFFLASANLSPCHKTMEENPIYLPEPGASELPVSRKALIFDETIEQVADTVDKHCLRENMLLVVRSRNLTPVVEAMT